MMDRLPELIACGVFNSFSPGHITVLAWFSAACLSLSHDRRALFFFALSFTGILCGLSLMLLTGFLGLFFLSAWYSLFSNTVMMLVGSWVFLTGTGLLRRWLRELQAPSGVEHPMELKILPFSGILKPLVVIVVAIVMACALATWPPAGFVTVLTMELLLPGKQLEAFILLGLYSLIKVIYLIFTAAAISLLARNAEKRKPVTSFRSTIYMLMASLYVAVGIGIIIVSINRM